MYKIEKIKSVLENLMEQYRGEIDASNIRANMPECDWNGDSELPSYEAAKELLTELSSPSPSQGAEAILRETMGNYWTQREFDTFGKHVLAAMESYRSLPVPDKGWIRETEQKPEFSKPVLVWCRIYGRYIATYEPIGEFQGVTYGNWHDGKQLGVLPPIYWMPLPQPPAQEGKM